MKVMFCFFPLRDYVGKSKEVRVKTLTPNRTTKSIANCK